MTAYPSASLGVRFRIAPATTAFNAQPSTYTWIDITSDVTHYLPITDTIGASDDVSEENTEQQLSIKNDSGRYTTGNPESDLFPGWDVGCPIEYAIDAGDGVGYVVQTITYLGEARETWPGNGPVKCVTEVTAGGQFRRLGLRPLLASTLYRSVLSSRKKAFWPLQEPAGAGSGASAIAGVPPLSPGNYGSPEFGITDTAIVPPGATSMVKMVTGSLLASLLPTPTTAQGIRISFLFHVEGTVPISPVGVFAIYDRYAVGSQKRYGLELLNNGLRFRAYDATGAEISGAGNIGFGEHRTETVWMEVEIIQTAVNTVQWTLRQTTWKLLADGTPNGVSADGTGSFSGTLGQLDYVDFGPNLDLDDVYIGMINIAEQPLGGSGGFTAVVGWAGNKATERVSGMCGEFGVPVHVTATNLGQAMGPQLNDSLLANLRNVKKTDHGVLTDHLGVVDYRALSELYNLAPAITLSRVSRGQLGIMAPVRDDTARVNVASTSRPAGSTATARNQADIDQFNIYEREPEEINVVNDAALLPHAGWYLARGVNNGKRYDELTIDLRIAAETTPAIVGQVLALKLGDRIAISSLPPQMAKGGIERQVRGRTQTVINRWHWKVTYRLVPVEAYNAFQLDVSRLDTSGTEVVDAVTSTGTAVNAVTAGALIRTGAGQSVSLDWAGEQVTMTDATTEPVVGTFASALASNWPLTIATAHYPTYAWNLGGAGGTVQASDWNSAAGVGTMNIPVANGNRRSDLIFLQLVNPDVQAEGSFAVSPTGGNIELDVLYRRVQASSNQYTARIAIEPALTTRLQLFAPGAANALADISLGITHSPGQTYSIRVAPIGARHRVKAWAGGAALEPKPWNIDLQDTSRTTAGSPGVKAGRAAGNTNAGALVATWDNFTVNNTQSLVVTRSVNTVVKAQAAGSRIKLWQGRGLGI